MEKRNLPADIMQHIKTDQQYRILSYYMDSAKNTTYLDFYRIKLKRWKLKNDINDDLKKALKKLTQGPRAIEREDIVKVMALMHKDCHSSLTHRLIVNQTGYTLEYVESVLAE